MTLFRFHSLIQLFSRDFAFAHPPPGWAWMPTRSHANQQRDILARQ
jgi:hypothetical protein